MKSKSKRQGSPASRKVRMATTTLAVAMTMPLSASSHSDAPLIKLDPQANLTDVYAFIGERYDSFAGASENVLNVLVSVRPFSDPGNGVIYEKFSDDALYSIHITNPSTGEQTLRYDFQFSDVNPLTAPGLKNPDTILLYGRGTAIGAISETGDAQQNFTQTYSIRKSVGTGTSALIATSIEVPPPNVGARVTPEYNDENGVAVSGFADFTSLDKYTQEAIVDAGTSGEAVFAGLREDGFFSDIPGIFDLLNPRIVAGDSSNGLGQAGIGIDGFKGYNVLSFAIQIPLNQLQTSTYTAPFADLANGFANGGAATNTGVGVYASVSRKRITLRRSNSEPLNVGQWLQVNRLGNPLFNEALVALRDKDVYNRTFPTGDEAFRTYAVTPELAVLLNAVFPEAFTPDIVETGRVDLGLVFIPDVLRVDTTTPPVRLPGQDGFSRVGFVGMDTTTNSAGRTISSGWPNGRRPGDDVTDVALTAIASGPSYETVTVLGDNVNSNDQLYNQVFPYLGTPHAGTTTNQRQGSESAE